MQPKYGTIEWEELYLKNRKGNPVWDFKALTEIHQKNADGKIVMAFCKKTNKWITGEYPVGGFRYMLTLRAALQFNGVWRTEEKAKEFLKKRNEQYGEDDCDVEIVHKNVTDADVLEALVGNFKMP